MPLFQFVEFRAVKDASICLAMFEGLSLGGRVLRIGRPADYKEPPPNLADYVVPLPANIAAQEKIKQVRVYLPRFGEYLS